MMTSALCGENERAKRWSMQDRSRERDRAVARAGLRSERSERCATAQPPESCVVMYALLSYQMDRIDSHCTRSHGTALNRTPRTRSQPRNGASRVLSTSLASTVIARTCPLNHVRPYRTHVAIFLDPRSAATVPLDVLPSIIIVSVVVKLRDHVRTASPIRCGSLP